MWFKDQFGASVATRVQFGLRERVLRAKVQISVTVVTLPGSPETGSPALSRTTSIC